MDTLLLLWILFSLPFGLFLGLFIEVGKGPKRKSDK